MQGAGGLVIEEIKFQSAQGGWRRGTRWHEAVCQTGMCERLAGRPAVCASVSVSLQVCASGSLDGLPLGLCRWLSVSAEILNIEPC